MRIKIAPRTPNAGSSLVWRTVGSAVADAEADADTVEEADVGVAVTLTLKTVVTTVVNEEI